MEEALDPKLILGVDSMDREHEHMASLVRELERAVQQAFPPTVVDGLLNVLLSGTRRHFAAEEQLMAEHGYPRSHEHRGAHVALLDDLKALIQKNTIHPLDVAATRSLGNWLRHHIGTLDRDLADHVRASGGSKR